MLMQGIEIIASQEITTEYAFNILAFWITFGLIFGLSLIMSTAAVITADAEWQIIPAVGIVGLSFGLLFGAITGDKLAKPIEYATEYKVTIEDSVPLAEFYERYEIVGQEGKMYIVREKAE